MIDTPDLATRLLDMCEKHGVDTGRWKRIRGRWRMPDRRIWGTQSATRTEIESLAFRLEGKLFKLGVEIRMFDGKLCYVGTSGTSWFGVPIDPDRIEAAILAAEKIGGEG